MDGQAEQVSAILQGGTAHHFAVGIEPWQGLVGRGNQYLDPCADGHRFLGLNLHAFGRQIATDDRQLAAFMHQQTLDLRAHAKVIALFVVVTVYRVHDAFSQGKAWGSD